MESYESLFEISINELKGRNMLHESITTVAIIASTVLVAYASKSVAFKYLGVKQVIDKNSNSYGIYDNGKTIENITLKGMYNTIKKYGTSKERKTAKKLVLKLRGSHDKDFIENIISEIFVVFKETNKRLGINITKVDAPVYGNTSKGNFKNILDKNVEKLNKNLKSYNDVKIGEEFGIDDVLEVFEFKKISPRKLEVYELNSIKTLCNELDYDFNTLKSYSIVGEWNGGEIILLGSEKNINYAIDFEMGDIYKL